MPISAGDKLGSYEIVASIGKGGMGEVWKARDPQLGRDVAIKVSAQQFTDRFEREASDGKMMAVPVKAVAGVKPSLEAGSPVALFDAHMAISPNDNVFQYDVTADGKRFLIDTMGGAGAAAPPRTVVTNWK